MSRSRKLLTTSLIFASVLVSVYVAAQESQETPAAPVPSQIAAAKRIFISNVGEEGNFRPPKDAYYSGGPNRPYNQFYAGMKSWGKYELLSTPADADLIFEISFITENVPGAESQFKVVILDPKTHTVLWTLTEYVEFAGMTKNRERNYDGGMASLLDDLKTLVSPQGPVPAK